MTLRHLQIFVAVCRYKSVTAAAEHLYLAQPTVSLAIRELEEHFSVKLFDRISRKLRLTEPGKRMLDYAARIVSLADEMESGARGLQSGPLRVGASVTIGTRLLPGYAVCFEKTHPAVKIRALIENSGMIENKIAENELDLALIEGVVHNPNIRREPFMEDEMVLICAKDDPLAKAGPLGAEDFPSCNFILREKGSGTREYFDSAMLLHNLSIKPAWESISTQAIVNAVAAGCGVSVLSFRQVKNDLESGRVRQIPLKDLRFRRVYYIIYHKNKFLTAPARDFIEMCKAGEPLEKNGG